MLHARGLVLHLRLVSYALLLLGSWGRHGEPAQATAAQAQAQAQAARFCGSAPFSTALYQGIDSDLRHWVSHGISEPLMDAALRAWTNTSKGHKGVGMLIEDGEAFVISVDLSKLKSLGHHYGLILAHVQLVQALTRCFGTQIPNVEFVITTADEPGVRLDKVPKGADGPVPILRFCKSEQHADVLVPYVHFQTKRYSETLLANLDQIHQEWPWEDKASLVFGRFASYRRIIHTNITELERKGVGGQSICKKDNAFLLFCEVRKHFLEWAELERQKGVAIDVARQPRVQMLDHARYKYLLHLDGQTCSSRLEQLMVMGSLIFKEDSGYKAFFHHLLRPYEHYVPFWKEGPEDLLDALEWAKTHDDDSRVMARNAQQLAAQYLNPQALTCYWFTVLARLSSLLTFKPGRQHRRYQQLVPASEFLSWHQRGMGLELKHPLLEDMELPSMNSTFTSAAS